MLKNDTFWKLWLCIQSRRIKIVVFHHNLLRKEIQAYHFIIIIHQAKPHVHFKSVMFAPNVGARIFSSSYSGVMMMNMFTDKKCCLIVKLIFCTNRSSPSISWSICVVNANRSDLSAGLIEWSSCYLFREKHRRFFKSYELYFFLGVIVEHKHEQIF